MDATSGTFRMNAEQSHRLSEEIKREGPRLRNFIRKRIVNDADVEDILQDVFSEFVEAYRLLRPIEHVSAWLFRVTRNRITDFLRKQSHRVSTDGLVQDEETDEMLHIEELIPAPDSSPEAAYLNAMMLDELDAALGELPPILQDVFIAHEFEGRSFKELSAETGVSVNTLISRKHYAVQHLRKRLQAIYHDIRNI